MNAQNQKIINYPVLTVDSVARLTGVPDIVKAGVMQYFTVNNPEYVEATKRNRRGASKISPSIKYFDVEKDALVFPRGAIKNILNFCRANNLRMAINDKRVAPTIIPDLEFTGTLRDYQEEAVSDMLKSEFGIIEAATGAGKTVIACALICKRKCPTLILVPTKELLMQWEKRILNFSNLREGEIGLIGDGHKKIKPITVGIVNSVSNIIEELKDKFGYLIVDEAHRAATPMYIGSPLTKLATKYMTGLSATPYRRDGLTLVLKWFMGMHEHRVNPARLRDINAVMKPLIYRRKTAFIFKDAQKNYQGMLSAMVKDEGRNTIIINELQADVLGRNGNGVSLVVSDRVEHLQRLKKMAETTSIPNERIALLTGSMKAENRRKTVDMLNKGAISVVFASSSLIAEGFDFSNFFSLHLVTPTNYKGRILQTVGRILRPEEGKVPVVVDYVDVCIGLLEHRAEQRLELLKTEAFGIEITHSPWGNVEHKENLNKEEKKHALPELKMGSEMGRKSQSEFQKTLAIKSKGSPRRQLALPGMQVAA